MKYFNIFAAAHKRKAFFVMLSRRYLRIKAFQAVYSWRCDEGNRTAIEQNLFRSIDQIRQLYLVLLLLLLEIRDVALAKIDIARNKNFPTEQDLNPNLKFVENGVLSRLDKNGSFDKATRTLKTFWTDHDDYVKKLWRTINTSPEYVSYMSGPNDVKTDGTFLARILDKHIAGDDILHDILENENFYWTDDLFVVVPHLMKTLKSLGAHESGASNLIPPLYKDEQEDRLFVRDLFRKTTENRHEYEELIGTKTKNWEVERIAMLDMLLMEMALAELETFPTIPVKVTLNEYIELSKMYSTPKSKVFVNGVLDRIALEWKESGRIVKYGRGLKE